MMDYEAFWRIFVVLFGLVPAAIGATALGALAWQNGKRGMALALRAIVGGAALGLCAFIGAILFFRV
jgi:hypothetical protein